jgi:hypothetical protein
MEQNEQIAFKLFVVKIEKKNLIRQTFSRLDFDCILEYKKEKK